MDDAAMNLEVDLQVPYLQQVRHGCFRRFEGGGQTAFFS
jgi:hypothetical protein